MSKIIKFKDHYKEPKPEELFWSCGDCSSTIFFITGDGEVVCNDCDAITFKIKGLNND